MRELAGHPAFKITNVSKVIESLVMSPARFRGISFAPIVNQNTDSIIVDIRKVRGGMTQAAVDDAEAPTVRQFGAASYSFTPAGFREKTPLGQKDFRGIRELGTQDQEMRLERLIADTLVWLRSRVESRIEWMRWKALLGNITINEGGIQFTVDYRIPTANTITLSGVDRWSQTETADPIRDLQDAMLKYEGTGYVPATVWFGSTILKYLLQNKRVRELIAGIVINQGAPVMTEENLRRVFTGHLGTLNWTYYSEGVHFITVLKETASTTTIKVESTSGFEQGQKLTLVTPDESRKETFTIASPVVLGSDTVVLDVAPSSPFPIGSTARAFSRFIPEDKAILQASLPAGAEGGPNWMEVISTRAVYPGNLVDPRPGVFAVTQDKTNDDPPSIVVMAGINALPILYFPDINYIIDAF